MGIGILNLSNLVRLSVHPEPPKAIADGVANDVTWPHKRETRHQRVNGKPRSIPSLHHNAVALDLQEHQHTGSAGRLEREHS
jgi:hypothetical protein